MTGAIDLHTHTTASDGILDPAALLQEAARRGLSVLGLTDHDTVDALPAAIAAGRDHGIEVVPGVELSAEGGPYEIHLLGYLLDPANPVLGDALADFRRLRERRIERMVDRLGTLGLPVELDRVRAIAGDGSVGRPHVARAMIEAGHVGTVAEAFDRYLANGRPGYVPRENFTPEEGVDLLVRAGAVPVLAHPFTAGPLEPLLERLVPRGLRGLETYYAEYDPQQHAALRAVADRWHLVPTGGSDYHGPGTKAGRELGSAPVPPDTVEQLSAAKRDPTPG